MRSCAGLVLYNEQKRWFDDMNFANICIKICISACVAFFLCLDCVYSVFFIPLSFVFIAIYK